jgi:lipoprotein NlpD
MSGELPRNHWPLAVKLVPIALLAAMLGLAGCGSSPTNRAPVEDRGSSAGTTRPAAAPAPQAAPQAGPASQPGAPVAIAPLPKPLPGAENEGKPGYYTVKPGDTLIRIGLDSGQNWRDIVRWNAIDNPNQIEVGQVLRVAPPVAGAPGAVAAAPAGAALGVVTRPVTTPSATATPVAPGAPSTQAAGASRPGTVVATAPGTAPGTAPSTAPGSAQATAPAGAASAVGAPTASGTPAPAPGANADEDIAWVWPSAGTLLAGFDEVKNKGIDIGGTAGAPVVAAADGRVVYVGAGLRGYGNLIILKHNNTYLTAYAHNQTLLVKEDQSVRRGQKIAEMGSSDADRVKLHFEVRRQGKPVDPARYLPPR